MTWNLMQVAAPILRGSDFLTKSKFLILKCSIFKINDEIVAKL